MEIIIDTSALLAVLCEQPEKTMLVQLTKGATLVAPLSLHWEIGNALSAMFKRRTIELETAKKVLAVYGAIPVRLLDIPLRQAVELSKQLDIYAYDAYFIACALNQKAPILTLDRELRDRAKSLKLSVLELSTI